MHRATRPEVLGDLVGGNGVAGVRAAALVSEGAAERAVRAAPLVNRQARPVGGGERAAGVLAVQAEAQRRDGALHRRDADAALFRVEGGAALWTSFCPRPPRALLAQEISGRTLEHLLAGDCAAGDALQHLLHRVTCHF